MINNTNITQEDIQQASENISSLLNPKNKYKRTQENILNSIN